MQKSGIITWPNVPEDQQKLDLKVKISDGHNGEIIYPVTVNFSQAVKEKLTVTEISILIKIPQPLKNIRQIMQKVLWFRRHCAIYLQIAPGWNRYCILSLRKNDKIIVVELRYAITR